MYIYPLSIKQPTLSDSILMIYIGIQQFLSEMVTSCTRGAIILIAVSARLYPTCMHILVFWPDFRPRFLGYRLFLWKSGWQSWYLADFPVLAGPEMWNDVNTQCLISGFQNGTFPTHNHTRLSPDSVVHELCQGRVTI